MSGGRIPGDGDMPARGIRSTVATNREHQALVKAGVHNRSPHAGADGTPRRAPPLQQFATHVADMPKLKDVGL